MVIRADAPPRQRRSSELRVAAALSRRPFGVRSIQTVAQLAEVSPTTAARALQALTREGVVCRRIDEVAEGQVRQVAVWTIDWRSPAWHAIAGQVGRLRAGLAARAGRTPQARHAEQATEVAQASQLGRVLAAKQARRVAEKRAVRPVGLAGRRVPQRLAHLFWNADLSRVDPRTHGSYVASRILRADDCQALGWLARYLHPDAIRAAAAGRGLDRRRATLAQVLAATSPLLGGA